MLTFSDVYASSGYIGGGKGHQNDGGNKIKILVHPIKKEKRFDTSVLFVLPEQLVGILEIPRDGDYKFYTPSSYYHGTNDKMPIDYIELFKQSLASLSDDVLTPFLVHLKDHLMTIQVCLGEIDQWIIESIGSAETCRQLLRDIFGDLDCIKLENERKLWRASYYGGDCKCHVEMHDEDEKCMRCRQSVKDHLLKLNQSRLVCPQDSSGNKRRKYPVPTSYFECKQPPALVLREIPVPSTMKHEDKFNILDDDERTRLAKFIEYMTSSDTGS